MESLYVSNKVKLNPEKRSLTINSNFWRVDFLIILIVLSIYIAKITLETLHIVDISDAVLLFLAEFITPNRGLL